MVELSLSPPLMQMASLRLLVVISSADYSLFFSFSRFLLLFIFVGSIVINGLLVNQFYNFKGMYVDRDFMDIHSKQINSNIMISAMRPM